MTDEDRGADDAAGSGAESTIDKAKGRVKEAAGDLVGDEGLQEQGQREQERGELKEDAAEKQAEAEKKEAEAEAAEEAAEAREG
jgi:uncharacterized protein YjbJ (UPF0337 family)